MTRGQLAKTLLALAILAAGIVLATRAIQQSQRQPAQPHGESPAQTTPRTSEPQPAPERHPHLLRAAEISYDTTPTTETVPDIASRAATRLSEIASTKFRAGEMLPPDRLAALIAVFEEHLTAVLLGDYDSWRSFVASRGITFTNDPGDDGGPPTRTAFEAGARVYQLAPLSIADATIRPLVVAGREIEHPTFYGGTAITRKGAPYGAPTDPVSAGATIYEILIPMRRHTGLESTPHIDANTGFAYYWSNAKNAWLPYSLKAYTDGAIIGSGAHLD